MIRCCLCRRAAGYKTSDRGSEPTSLPGSGYRCTNREACAARVRAVVSAHTELGKVCQ